MTQPRVTHNGRANDVTVQTYRDGYTVILDLNTGAQGSFITFNTNEDALTIAALLIAAAYETELA